MNGIEDYTLALKLLAPEIVIVAAILLCSIWPLFIPKLRHFTAVIALSSLGIAFYGLFLEVYTINNKTNILGGFFAVDPLTLSFGMLICVVGMIVVLMTSGYEHHFGNNNGEFYTLLLTAVLAVMLLAGTTDLIMFFVGIETLSICCVLLAGFAKGDVKSNEASLKYLLSTAAVTATLLYGLSFVYGLTGSTNYDTIREQMQVYSLPPTSLVKVFLLVLVLSAIGFKLSAVPFHMWTPDVYEGAPTPVTAFLSIGSKAGGLVAALRLFLVVFGNAAPDWAMLVAALSILCMLAGNFIAIAQTSFKRMLAYSSIAHVGYILIGFISFTEAGLASMFFYVIVYGIMNLGAFAASILFTNETGSDRIDDYAGLIRRRPMLAILLSICLFNLAGLPIPPAGFFAKLFIFATGLTMPLTLSGNPVGPSLVAVGLFTSIPAVYYYTRVVIKMIAREPSEVVAALPQRPRYVGSPQEGPMVALTVCVVGIFLTSTPFVDQVMSSSRFSLSAIVPNTDRLTPVAPVSPPTLPTLPTPGNLRTP